MINSMKFTNIETTPMKWYKFIMWVRLPLTVLGAISYELQSFQFISVSSNENPLVDILQFINILIIFLAIGAISGLSKYSKSGIQCYCIFSALEVISYGLVSYYQYSFGIALVGAIFFSLKLIPEYIYFKHRITLFGFNVTQSSEPNNDNYNNQTANNDTYMNMDIYKVNCCRFCGKFLGDRNGKYCRFCGKQLTEFSADKHPISSTNTEKSSLEKYRNEDAVDQEKEIVSSLVSSESSMDDSLNIAAISKLRSYKKMLDEGLISDSDYSEIKERLLQEIDEQMK